MGRGASLSPPFYKEEMSSERLSLLPEVTQLVNRRMGSQVYVVPMSIFSLSPLEDRCFLVNKRAAISTTLYQSGIAHV